MGAGADSVAGACVLEARPGCFKPGSGTPAVYEFSESFAIPLDLIVCLVRSCFSVHMGVIAVVWLTHDHVLKLAHFACQQLNDLLSLVSAGKNFFVSNFSCDIHRELVVLFSECE